MKCTKLWYCQPCENYILWTQNKGSGYVAAQHMWVCTHTHTLLLWQWNWNFSTLAWKIPAVSSNANPWPLVFGNTSYTFVINVVVTNNYVCHKYKYFWPLSKVHSFSVTWVHIHSLSVSTHHSLSVSTYRSLSIILSLYKYISFSLSVSKYILYTCSLSVSKIHSLFEYTSSSLIHSLTVSTHRSLSVSKIHRSLSVWVKYILSLWVKYTLSPSKHCSLSLIHSLWVHIVLSASKIHSLSLWVHTFFLCWGSRGQCRRSCCGVGVAPGSPTLFKHAVSKGLPNE